MMLRGWTALLATISVSCGSVLAQQSFETKALAVAQEPSGGHSQSDRRIALVIGNGAYQDVARLPNPVNDAQLMAKTLRGAGFALVGGGPQVNLDKAHFDQLVQQFGRELPGADVALFYYSGHGMQVQGENWLVPVDANPTSARDMDFQMVNAGLVLRQMEGAGTRLNMVILDACRNNPFPIRAVRAAAGGLGEMAAPEGTLISYATQPGNVALDGDTGDSPYTVALVTAIRRSGSDVFHVFNEVGLAVKKETAGAQQPWLAASPIAGGFYFFSGPAAMEGPNNVAPAPLPQPRQGNRFDGIWSVEMTCPTEGVAVGYHKQFGAQVSNGSIHGQSGNPAEPGALAIDGTIDADGLAILTATGRTYRTEHNIASMKDAAAGTLYHYNVNAQFDAAVGTGERMDGLRTCKYVFRLITADRRL